MVFCEAAPRPRARQGARRNVSPLRHGGRQCFLHWLADSQAAIRLVTKRPRTAILTRILIPIVIPTLPIVILGLVLVLVRFLFLFLFLIYYVIVLDI